MTGRRSHWTERGDDNIFLRLAIVVRLSLLWLRMGFLSWDPLVWILDTQVRRVLGGNDQHRAKKQNVVLTWFRPVTWSSGHLGPWFSGRGRPAVHWIARTSSLDCLSCRNPYQTPHSLNCLPPFHWKTPFFTEKCFVASPSQKSASIMGATHGNNQDCFNSSEQLLHKHLCSPSPRRLKALENHAVFEPEWVCGARRHGCRNSLENGV